MSEMTGPTILKGELIKDTAENAGNLSRDPFGGYNLFRLTDLLFHAFCAAAAVFPENL